MGVQIIPTSTSCSSASPPVKPALALAAWTQAGSAVGCGVVRVTGVIVKTVGVEFFCHHRDRPGSVALRYELLEEHWSYMDRYQAQMIARGPTLAGDGDTPTGSVHILGLPAGRSHRRDSAAIEGNGGNRGCLHP